MREWDEMIARQVSAAGVRTTWGEHVAPPGGEVTMTDDRILSGEQMYEWLIDGPEDTMEADDMVYRSHEALRARLTAAEERAEQAEQERDAQRREARFNYRCASELTSALARAEAQVAALTEALRFYADERRNEGDRLVRDGGDRARTALAAAPPADRYEQVRCEACDGTGGENSALCGCGPGVRHVVDCGTRPRPCSTCNGEGYVKVAAPPEGDEG